MKNCIPLLLVCCFCPMAAASVWQDVLEEDGRAKSTLVAKTSQVPRFAGARLLDLDVQGLSHVLGAAINSQAEEAATRLQLPLPDGRLAEYYFVVSPVLSPLLQAKYPQFRTYRAVDVVNPNNTGRLDYTPNGFHAVLTHNGRDIYIDPLGEHNQYQSYYKDDYIADKKMRGSIKPMQCRSRAHGESSAEGENHYEIQAKQRASTSRKIDLSFGTSLTTYRLAVAATGEFTAFHGGTVQQSLAALVTGINRINQVFERDLAVRLELVGDNDKVIYTDASTDPFGNSGGDLADEAVNVLNNEIGFNNYDVGHVVSGQGSGGLAEFRAVCGAFKGAGETASDRPINDPFFIDFVAHELGHQFGSEHSFNGGRGSCQGSRVATTAFEPGSGTTIMGYAGLCGDEDVQPTADAYFHSNSIEQMRDYLGSPTGSSCGLTAVASNNLPVVNAGPDNAIPRQTPFVLTGSASDSDARDNLSYSWEQIDLGAATRSRADFVDDGQRPLFRSFLPVDNPSRTFPQISDVVNATTTYGEILPTTARELNFRFTVRDGNGGVVSDDRRLTVIDTAGPFTVSSPGSGRWNAGTQTIVWDVANTTAAPISCDNVDISLSTDAGMTFDTSLAGAVPNSGSADVEIPTIDTSVARVRVHCANQPFFAVNTSNITIGEGGTAGNTPPVAVADSYTVAQTASMVSLDVLSNDSDAENNTLRIIGVSNISSGTATIANDALSINYTPASSFSGSASFDYRVSDGAAEATASVTVSVTAAPAPTPTPTPAPAPSSGGGGGSVSLYFLVLLLTALAFRRPRMLNPKQIINMGQGVKS